MQNAVIAEHGSRITMARPGAVLPCAPPVTRAPRALVECKVALVHRAAVEIVVRVRQLDFAHQQHAVTLCETAARINHLVGAAAEEFLKTLNRFVHIIGYLHHWVLAALEMRSVCEMHDGVDRLIADVVCVARNRSARTDAGT